ncbi:hypothetical protein DSM112329_02908 [Paraconexibacter sp. AEG42_29]|uniref:Uncharacterized protein n=2 Tax=Paraconexibacter sp. AEG42_29 TaxID=2997339 RepID=A0AAU7AWL0_9ACTN
MASDFHLRPTNIIGGNYNADDLGEVADATARTASFRPSAERIVEPHPELARHIQERCLESFPARYFDIRSVDVDDAQQTAHAVTKDGSCGLRRTGNEWRMTWAWA